MNYLTEAEEKVLFAHMKNRNDRQAERDCALLRLCRATGLRRGEVLALNVGDVINRDRIVIDERIAVKGAVGEVYLPVEIQDLIRRFLRLKRTWRESVHDDAPLFVSRRGARLSLRSFNDIMEKWCLLREIDEVDFALTRFSGDDLDRYLRDIDPETCEYDIAPHLMEEYDYLVLSVMCS